MLTEYECWCVKATLTFRSSVIWMARAKAHPAVSHRPDFPLQVLVQGCQLDKTDLDDFLHHIYQQLRTLENNIAQVLHQHHKQVLHLHVSASFLINADLPLKEHLKEKKTDVVC